MLYHHILNGDPLMLKGRHFMAALVLSALVATLPHPRPSEASGRWPGEMPYPRSEPGVEALQRKIAEADRAAERMGYFPIGVERSSTIRPPRQTETVSVLLGSGRYMIIGQCDTGCADMDLEVRDLSTGEVIPEEKPRGYPIVLLQLREQRNLAVKVVIEQCPSQSCRYSVKLYAAGPSPSTGHGRREAPSRGVRDGP